MLLDRLQHTDSTAVPYPKPCSDPPSQASSNWHPSTRPPTTSLPAAVNLPEEQKQGAYYLRKAAEAEAAAEAKAEAAAAAAAPAPAPVVAEPPVPAFVSPEIEVIEAPEPIAVEAPAAGATMAGTAVAAAAAVLGALLLAL